MRKLESLESLESLEARERGREKQMYYIDINKKPKKADINKNQKETTKIIKKNEK